jgi:hypothetical protein
VAQLDQIKRHLLDLLQLYVFRDVGDRVEPRFDTVEAGDDIPHVAFGDSPRRRVGTSSRRRSSPIRSAGRSKEPSEPFIARPG